MSSHRRRAAALAILLLGAAAPAVGAQQTFPQTIYWGSGLVDIPVAWVSPVTGDFAASFSGKQISGAVASVGVPQLNGLNTNMSFGVSLLGRAEVGIAVYSDNPEWGAFGRVVLLDESRLQDRAGPLRWLPSVAIGMRNVGPYKHIDRFTVGYDMARSSGGGGFDHVADSLHQGFNTANTVYGVATKSLFQRPGMGLSVSLGYGNGLFKDDAGLDSLYSRHSWNGVFAGAKLDFYPSRTTTFSLLAENNSWDYNLGAVFDWRGLQAGAYWTEVGAGSQKGSTEPAVLYNYSKFAFTLGWQSNLLGLVRGDFLRDRLAQLQKQQQQLLAEIAVRQQRIAALELEINRYQAQNLLELEQRRSQAEAQLRAEREALQRLEERLRRLEQNAPPPQQNPPE